MTDKQPDYTTMSGAEFQRAVGTDPERWAAAFLQVYATSEVVKTDADRQAFVAGWMADAMDAAVKAQGQLLNWDEEDDGR